ncbi:MAG: DEAD/DEAH box helicase, partial [Prevotellaceae bacterium]|nr:DEAD/DEAH box helicase [Prevotellaceae bacterium]
PDKTKVETKQYIIDLISKLFKEYAPEKLYYKVLYEMFKKDLDFSTSEDFKREMKHLSETVIYQTLYPYQQKGVISLIKMLQNYNGAILADAVGLGKTWTALAVMKYFQSKGYTVVLLCPKKLGNNWLQYRTGSNSKFEKDDIDYTVRYHSDLQDDRLDINHYSDVPLSKIQRKHKLLLVIDESHNLRNDKSSRYKYLIENILQPDKLSKDIKVLQLSATPINNKLLDIRNQFKLMVKGQDNGFKDEEKLSIGSLENIFRTAQRDYTLWAAKPDHKIADFIAKLQENFFKLTDALIVARTRKMIADEFGGMNFPKKEKPDNVYITPNNIGNLKSFDDILNAIQVKMSAYRPSEYILERKKGEKKAIEDEVAREQFLVKMMYILLIKRLESSWHSFKLTAENILKHHENALNKVNKFIEFKTESSIETGLSEEDTEDLENALEETAIEEVTLGKKNPVKLSEISAIKTFQKDLENDVKKLRKLAANLDVFEKQFNENTLISNDEKLEKLLQIIKEKQEKPNKKVLIFTVYSDTAKFLYDNIKNIYPNRVACITGSQAISNDGHSGKKFESILERFAPYTKLFKEKNWDFEGDDYEEWKRWIANNIETRQEVSKALHSPIDILIATDCLSEGQNMQDCDLIINYDIHWNPVRLIQRMGRIDRIGSPNTSIKGINFWPAKDYEDYLNLKSRVESRMAAMTLVGTEFNEDLTPELKEMVKDNPLISDQTQKMLAQLQLTWDDVEDGDETLGLNNLSLEEFRQELLEFFKKNEQFFKQMPNGIYTGFKKSPHEKYVKIPDSIIAVLGYPKRPEDTKDWVYNEIHLLHQPIGVGRNEQLSVSTLQNRNDILNFLRFHKLDTRFVPKSIDDGEPEALQRLAKAIEEWITERATPVAVSQIQDLF